MWTLCWFTWDDAVVQQVKAVLAHAQHMPIGKLLWAGCYVMSNCCQFGTPGNTPGKAHATTTASLVGTQGAILMRSNHQREVLFSNVVRALTISTNGLVQVSCRNDKLLVQVGCWCVRHSILSSNWDFAKKAGVLLQAHRDSPGSR